MFHSCSPELFLKLRDSDIPLFDVRSPQEFCVGHIPKAINLPLFSDDERAVIGTFYSHAGREAATHKALELIGSQLSKKLSQAWHLTGKKREVLLYCWRGGLRSGTMAWLLEAGGYKAHLLDQGYKAYRSYIRQELGKSAKILVLGGMTGSGKTEILHELAKLGSQVIDLEDIAGHRGSAFGGLGLPDQPSNESVENKIHDIWSKLDLSRPVWLEDENRHIGTVTLPEPVFTKITQGRLVLIDIALDARIERLTQLYADHVYDSALLYHLERIHKRLGNDQWRQCSTAVREKRYKDAVRGVLHYYDKAYQHLLDFMQRPLVKTIHEDNPAQIATILAEREQSLAENSQNHRINAQVHSKNAAGCL